MSRKIKKTGIYRSNIGVFKNSDDEQSYLWKEREFDKKGNLLSEIVYTRNGREDEKTEYEYNDSSKTTKLVSYPQDNTTEKTVYSYNSAGEVEEESLFYDDELFIKQKSIFNEKGLHTATENYDESDNLTGRETFEYDNNGQVIKHTHFNESEEKDWEIEFIYNDKKQVVKEVHKNLEENRQEAAHYEYNDAGKSVRSETIDADGKLVAFVEVTYDENNRPVKYVSETMGYNFSKVINQVTYNEDGKILENEYYDVLNGQLSARESYVYDEEGNIKTEEQFELRSQGDKKMHYRLNYAYEYFAEEEN